MEKNVVDVNGSKYFRPPQTEEKSPSSCTSGLHGSLPFHLWLRNQDDWVIDVAQENEAYQAMKLAYEANAEPHGSAASDDTVEAHVGQ